ncbi:hypothetical protein ONO86_00568 [Micromonospora noduli]|nr:hypothetical protein ONO86_00568 [Micromonospora noduli]
MASALAQHAIRASPLTNAPMSHGIADTENQMKMRAARRWVCGSRRTAGIRNSPRPR